jgi:SOS-response transcriptional repressor LexA
MFRNLHSVKSEPKITEWLSLDDYVSADTGNKMLYVRVCGGTPGMFSKGDLVVCDLAREPKPSDIVLCRADDSHSIKKYSDIKSLINPLRLAARNGQALENGNSFDRFEVVGVITHRLETLTDE